MPNRIIREGIIDSDPVNTLSFPAEVFYRRLMSVVDDFGRFDGRPAVLRGRLYPLKLNEVREADISRWIAECVKAGLIVLYTANSRQYILFRKLGSPRAKASKYPPPPEEDGCPCPCQEDEHCAQMQADASRRAQAEADVPYSYSGTGSYSGESPIGDSCPEPPKPADSGPPPVLVFPVTGSGPKEWGLTAAKVDEYRTSFPGVDVLAECRAARQWCIDNPSRRKTPRGMPAFLSRWLSKAQDFPARRPPAAGPRPSQFETPDQKVMREINEAVNGVHTHGQSSAFPELPGRGEPAGDAAG